MKVCSLRDIFEGNNFPLFVLVLLTLPITRILLNQTFLIKIWLHNLIIIVAIIINDKIFMLIMVYYDYNASADSHYYVAY